MRPSLAIVSCFVLLHGKGFGNETPLVSDPVVAGPGLCLIYINPTPPPAMHPCPIHLLTGNDGRLSWLGIALGWYSHLTETATTYACELPTTVTLGKSRPMVAPSDLDDSLLGHFNRY